MKLIQTQDYLLLIDKEAEIKENTNTFKEGFNGDWFWNSKYNSIQRIGDITEFDFKIISFYPLTKEAKELEKLPLLPNPFENSFDITKWAKEEHKYNHRSIHELSFVLGCEVGYEKAQSKQFNLEDIVKAIEMAYSKGLAKPNSGRLSDVLKVQEEIIQSLFTQQLPVSFEPEYKKQFIKYDEEVSSYKGDGFIANSDILKTITNSEGKEEIQGRYVY